MTCLKLSSQRSVDCTRSCAVLSKGKKSAFVGLRLLCLYRSRGSHCSRLNAFPPRSASAPALAIKRVPAGIGGYDALRPCATPLPLDAARSCYAGSGMAITLTPGTAWLLHKAYGLDCAPTEEVLPTRLCLGEEELAGEYSGGTWVKRNIFSKHHCIYTPSKLCKVPYIVDTAEQHDSLQWAEDHTTAVHCHCMLKAVSSQ